MLQGDTHLYAAITEHVYDGTPYFAKASYGRPILLWNKNNSYRKIKAKYTLRSLSAARRSRAATNLKSELCITYIFLDHQKTLQEHM